MPAHDFSGRPAPPGFTGFFAVRDNFPGLLPVARDGRMIIGELYDMADEVLVEKLLPSEPAELELGDILLDDGEPVKAMILVPERLKPSDKIVDISELGGFRSYQAFLRSNAELDRTLGRAD